MVDLESTSSNILEEIQCNKKEIDDQNIIFLPKKYVSLEYLFTRYDQKNKKETMEESSTRKVQET
jgi:hypothetical protein